jgi:hypothetical protein
MTYGIGEFTHVFAKRRELNAWFCVEEDTLLGKHINC